MYTDLQAQQALCDESHVTPDEGRAFGQAELRQAQLEIEAREEGIKRTRELIERARSKDEWALKTAQGRHLLSSHVSVFAEAIRWAQQNGKPVTAYRAGGSNRGPKVVYLRELLDVSEEVLAAITLSAMMDAAETGGLFNNTASTIGRRLEEEAQVLWVERNEPDFLHRFLEALRRDGSRSKYAARRLNIEMRNKMSAGWERWGTRVRFQLGAALAEAACTLTPLFAKELITERKNRKAATRVHIRWSPEADAALRADMAKIEDRAAKLWPMVCRPQPWSGPTGGGYLTLAVPQQRFVRGARPRQTELLLERPPVDVYAAVNAVS